MDKLKKHYDLEVYWRSFELRPADAPPIPEAYLRMIQASRPRFIEIAREQYGLEVDIGPFGINSRAALVGAKYAEAQGKGEAYHSAVMQAYWQQGQSIADTDVLLSIAENCGLDKTAFQNALSDPVYDAAVTKDIALAEHYGLTGVPALVFAGTYLVVGAQPYEVLEQIVQKIQQM
ncbi:MAG: DsbA family protein [Anaerolineae bacterium]|nr:DsbA family protein [Anaerolineae bacterium]